MLTIDSAAATTSIGEESLRVVLNEIQTLALSKGLKVPPARPVSWEKFSGISSDKQRRFLGYLEKFISPFCGQLEEADEFLNLSIENEMSCLDLIADGHGLKLPRDLETKIAQGDIVEIYDLDGIQIYRNLNFFKTTNYNLLDIASHTWMELWDRSTRIQQQIVSVVRRALDSDKDEAIPFEVAPHLLKERAFGMTQALVITLKYVAPVRTQFGQLYGFLTIMQAMPVAEGKEADKIGFV